MKITIISDTHLGFDEGGEREADSFDALKEVLERSLDSDVILLPGDIFDKKVPSQETVSKALNMFVKLLSVESDVEIVEGVDKGLDGVEHKKISGIPVIAIHGTHERRTRGLVNPIETLERAGFLIHLDCNGVILKKGEEFVCLQGLSGIPDQYVEKTLQEWNPKPVPNCFNIFMLHQSLEGFLYAPHLVPLKALPKNFDMYINGHIHNPEVSSYGTKPLIITGSTVQTQLNKESVKPRGFWFFDTENLENGVQYIEINSQRRVYYDEFNNAKEEQMERKIKQILSNYHHKKPVIRFKITGSLDVDTNALKKKYQDVALLSFRKDIEKEGLETKTIEEQKMSVDDLGKKLLRQNLESAKLDPVVFETVFEMMEGGRQDFVVEFMRSSINNGNTLEVKQEKTYNVQDVVEDPIENVKVTKRSGPTRQFNLSKFSKKK